ncbi:MBL fold metallo-hydrolase [Hoyosella altamirensis]|uniref:Glyoxylase-like metal-dependent hydrolase (Beta-lactamase superfamily II) n=1 Tax=Hoyosella altamirensis TaxID=616997 RepID=A0A839RN68_9ACTN|nr:MBL fold metallo-hydrolase [Hoyosella altamirensis]MBB3037837.1 glyoxylase-like metal-dependent hydrolase (beta-lactamase superfamily II) [Hoyosella altamirensis]
MTLEHPAYGAIREVSPFASVVLAENPGYMTLDGTNTWILRAPDSPGCVIVDPGPDDEAHLRRVASAGPVDLILITHRHIDHTEGIDSLARLVQAPVRGLRPEDCRDASPLEAGERLDVSGLTLEVLSAPGHTADSMMFTADVSGERALLTGDTILGRGTTVLDAYDGDLGAYLETLDQILDLGSGIVGLPGHGPETSDVAAVALEYKAHREERLEQIRAALRVLGNDVTAREVVEHVYSDVGQHLWPAAEASVRVQLAYLRQRA